MNQPLPRHGGQLRIVADRFGLDPAKLLDFSANINPDGPPPSAVKAMQDALANGQCLTQYPDLEELHLRQALAEYAGVHLDQVLVGNGFVPLLDAALRALCIRSCVLPVPAFNEYRRVLEQNDVAVRPVTLRAELGFHYQFAELLGLDSDAILLANPQNPTGVLCDRATLLDFVMQAADRGKRVLLDEAFIDYVPAHSLAAMVEDWPNLVVFRSLTKFFGMPALRVAFALVSTEAYARISTYLPPWPITTFASLAAAAAVKDRVYIDRGIAANDERNTFLRSGLERLDVQVARGTGNFVLFKVPNARAMWQGLVAEHRIVLRSCDDYEALPDNYLRSAVRDEIANSTLLRALHQQLSSPRSLVKA